MTPIVQSMLDRGWAPEQLRDPDVLAMIFQRAGGEAAFSTEAEHDQIRSAILNSGPSKGSVFRE